MTEKKEYSSWPCPNCGSFKLIDDQVLQCVECEHSIRRNQYKVSMEYAAFVYRFGHLFSSVYGAQLEADNKITPVSLEAGHPIAVATTLVILTSLHTPGGNWFMVKQGVKRFTTSYAEATGVECNIEEDELKAMNKNIRMFTLSFGDADPRLRNAVFEEIFAEYCTRTEHEKLLAMQQNIATTSPDKREALQAEFDSFFEKAMNKTFKKVANLPKPEPTELALYWKNLL